MTQSQHIPSASELTQRSPEEIFAHHGQALGTEDLDATVLDYAADAVLITPEGARHGKDAIRDFFAAVFQALPQAKWGVKPIFTGNILFLEWTADSPKGSVFDGVDTFIFEDGLIKAQTVRCTIVPK